MTSKSETGSRGARFDELIDKSARIFAKNGFKSTTIQEIGREMGWSSAAIYYYVNSKNDILYEIWRRAGERLQSAVEEIASQPMSAKDKIRLFFRSHLDLIMGERPIFEILILQRSRIPMKGKFPLEKDERKYLKTFAALISDIPCHELRHDEAEILALGALNMLNGVIRWYVPGGRLSLSEIADLYCDIFMDGIFKEHK